MIGRSALSRIGWVAFGVLGAACSGGEDAAGGDTGADTTAVGGPAWVGEWIAVTEDDAPAEGTLSLSSTTFAQTSDFMSGTCTWTGTVSDATETTLTISTETGTGAIGCDQAVGVSASPTWSVSDSDTVLTLDYRDAVPFGTLQVWQRE